MVPKNCRLFPWVRRAGRGREGFKICRRRIYPHRKIMRFWKNPPYTNWMMPTAWDMSSSLKQSLFSSRTKIDWDHVSFLFFFFEYSKGAGALGM